MYMTLSQKRAYVDEDFANSQLCQMGDLPKDKNLAHAYYEAAMNHAGSFLDRYKDKGDAISAYAKELVNDWFDTLERVAKENQADGK